MKLTKIAGALTLLIALVARAQSPVIGPTFGGGSPGASLPTATAAGQAPVSTGPGTTYTAQPVPPGGGVWQREGTIISPSASEEYNASEPTLLYEGSPQIAAFSGLTNVWKMWWNCGYLTTGLCYAESSDAENWVRWPSGSGAVIARANPGPAHGYVFHYNGTYYYYAGNGAASSTQINMYTSTNGVSWTLVHSAVLTLGSGTWDSNQFGNVFIIPSAGTWQMMYEAYGAAFSNGVFWMGVATSADQGVTWVKSGSNPVLKGPSNGEAGGPEIHQVGSTYYVWFTCNGTANQFTPTDICRAHSTNFTTWTLDNGGTPVMTRATQDEGVGGAPGAPGQIADPSMVQVGNTIYMAYDGVLAQNGTSPDAFHLKLATAPYTFTQLVQTNEGNATNYHANGSFENLNLFPCFYYDYNSANIRVPCGTTGVLNFGALQMLGNAPTVGFNYNMWFNGASNIYTANGASATGYLDLTGGVYHFWVGPVGTAGGVSALSEIYNATSAGMNFISPTTFNSTQFIKPAGGLPAITISQPGATTYSQMGFGGTLTTPVWQYGAGNPSETALGVANKLFFYNVGSTSVAASIDASNNFEIGMTGVLPGTFSKKFQVGTSGQFNVDSSGNTTTPSITGPATAPSGACSTAGQWVFSQDGHATFCPSAGGTWATKI
jgi:hypothetical protein